MLKERRNYCLKKQPYAIAIFILLFWCPLSALNPEKKIDQYLIDQWQESDGILSNTIISIKQTPDNYLWIASSRGLSRYNGIKFSVMSYLEEDKIKQQQTATPYTLFVDKAGTLWIGSSVGLTSYQYKKDQFKTYTSTDGLTNDRIRHIQEDMRGNLWITFFSSYVNLFSRGKFESFNNAHGLTGKKINAILEDYSGNLLFGSRENGVFIFKEQKFSKYPIQKLKNHQIIAMCEDHKLKLWIGTNNGLFRVHGSYVEKYCHKNGLSHNYVTVILEDSERNLWIGTVKGLNRLKRKQNGGVAFEKLLRSYTITCLFEDREKNLWVGTFNSGLMRLKDSKFIAYSPLEKFPGEMFTAVFQDRKADIWIGTLNGELFHFKDKYLIELIKSPKLSGTGIAAIREDVNGNIWLGTNGKGVFQRMKESGTFVQYTTQHGLTDNLVTSIFLDSRRNLWFCTFDGVSVRQYNDGVIQSLTFRDGLSGKIAHNVYEDRSRNIWIAADKGVTVLNGGQIAKQNIKHYLKGISIASIYEDPATTDSKNRLYWIATHGAGLKRLKLNDGSITSYTTENGMTTNLIYQILEDQQAYFWLTSDIGILRVSKSELNLFAKGELDQINCIYYDISDGMKSSEFNNQFSRHSLLKTHNGELWFITKKGISIFKPGKTPMNKVPPPVVIEAVFFDQQSIPLHQEANTYTFKSIEDVKISFNAPTFLSPEKAKFKYILKGFDVKWQYLSPEEERAAYYKDLAPGSYTFLVTACNSEGVWNDNEAVFSFIIEPLFFQTSFFLITSLTLAAAFLFLILYFVRKRPFTNQKKYQTTPLNPYHAEECIKKLEVLMKNNKVYRNEKISLRSLAKKIGISSHLLSRILNEKLKCGFSTYINSYRVEEAKEILSTPNGVKKTIITIGHDVGFNSMTAFHKIFKKYTGKTPKQYRKEAAQK